VRLEPDGKGRRATLCPLSPRGLAIWPNVNKIVAAGDTA
jgi:hypothetical protein